MLLLVMLLLSSTLHLVCVGCWDEQAHIQPKSSY